jgi:uncharacterized damage-inducible protein DinB
LVNGHSSLVMSMKAVELVRRLHQHRGWVNGNLVQAARGLSDEQLRRPFAIGQGSVWRSLTHLYAGEFVWLEALEGRESATAPGDVAGKLPGNQEGERAARTLAELESRWGELNTRWEQWLSELTDAALDEQVARVSTSSGAGKRFVHTKGDVAVHVCTHAHYTAAQVVNMLRQLGAGLPETMLISLARMEQGLV